MRISTLLALAVTSLLWGCGSPPTEEERVAGGTKPEVLRHWAETCALCHVTGNGGAPRLGHPEEWRARLAQGRGVLLTRTLEGFNNMPPLGYCMACERDDFVALIDFMVADVDTAPEGGQP